MMRSMMTWLGVVGGGLLLAAAVEGRNPSHGPVPARPGAPVKTSKSQFDDLLSERLRQARQKETERLLGDLLDDADRNGVKDLLHQLRIVPTDLKNRQEQIDLSDPLVRKFISQMLRQHQDNPYALRLDAETLRRLQEVSRSLPEMGDLLPPTPPTPSSTLPTPPKSLPPNDASGLGTDVNTQNAQQMQELSQRIEELGGPWKDSPLMREIARDLLRAVSRWQPKGEGFDEQMARLNGYAREANEWWQASRSVTRNWKLPRFSWDAGVGDTNLTANAAPMSPEPSSWDSGGDAGGWGGLWWLVLLLPVAVIVWKLSGYFPRRTRANAPLGFWPVAPAELASRTDVVRAFEYLSLARCGLIVRTWNHRQIAAQLAGTAASQRQAAQELAELYEQARYAPDEDELSDEQLRQARRHVCLLTEVTGP
ncbi:MAG: DUF4129 domain-containing protein [Gemmataceae bacterium]